MIFNSNRTLPDGRIMTSHVIKDRIVDMQNFNIRVIIRSYLDNDAVNSDEYVDFFVDIQHTDYQMSYIDNLESQVIPLTWTLLNADAVENYTLSELKTLKRAQIDEWRGAARYANTFAIINNVSYEWQADATSQDLLSTAINFAVLGINAAPPVWRTFNNIDVTVTLNDLKTIAGAMAQQTSIAYYHSFVLKAQVESATTSQQLETIVWQ